MAALKKHLFSKTPVAYKLEHVRYCKDAEYYADEKAEKKENFHVEKYVWVASGNKITCKEDEEKENTIKDREYEQIIDLRKYRLLKALAWEHGNYWYDERICG